MARPFLHPAISRLRSAAPSASQSRAPSAASAGTPNGGADSPLPSHFSALSPVSSSANLHLDALGAATEKRDIFSPGGEREVFRWTSLHVIASQIFSKPAVKAAAVLGAHGAGTPLVMAANGLICIGTDQGRVYVYDFKQTLKCICGDQAMDSVVGPVTALALSHDHTYVAVGHLRGHIQLFDLAKPEKPVRFVPPTTFAAVVSGRKEGHLEGSRIVSIGFIAGRHTAIVSADQHGLAFYHSLGKVLFVDASDVLRILGKYPDEEALAPPTPSNGSAPQFRRRRTRKTNTLLGMAPLPLGTVPHATDAYNVIALLTGAKLVIVGLKPSPKTWYRRHRDEDEERMGKSKFRGTLAWFPSVHSGKPSAVSPEKKSKKSPPPDATVPMLVYSWGSTINLVRVSETKVAEQIANQRTGKTSSIEVGRLTFEEAARWAAHDDILAMQWLNVKQILLVTLSSIEVYDVNTQKLVEHVPFTPSSLISPTLGLTVNGAISYSDSLGDVAHSVRIYKGKIFLLHREDVQVGMLLTWADRVLAFVEDGNFLSAIETTRMYYLGTAPGNTNGLPDDPAERRTVVGEKVRELMVASMRYAFSEDRMTDGTHYTPDGRGLVATFARACIALNDFDLLWEDLFQEYDDAGIARIYLEQLETFIFDNNIRFAPPRITQRLIAMHAEDRRPDLAERAIWHLDPECLDINQSIHLCQEYKLYDALVYVYTRALQDYVSPIVDLLALVRRVMQFRRDMAAKAPTEAEEHAIEPIFLNAYKIFPYLANVLSGLSYPSEEPLSAEEADQAKHDVYTFLFFGRSSVWPVGEGGKLILTADEEGGMEPTYPYTRLLLRFDAEAFLHSLDLAFEDNYLDDEEGRHMTRLVVIKIVLDILADPSSLTPADRTFVRIFVARNVPKYPQFLQNAIAPSTFQALLVGLAQDPDPETREDRQLAAEYLLSAYTPHDSSLLALFEEARFYRILRSWHRQDRRWAQLLLAHLHDSDLKPKEIFSSVEEILRSSAQANDGEVPIEVLATLEDTLPRFLDMSVANTARFVDTLVPDLHVDALDALGADGPRQFAYLHYLLGPPSSDDGDAPPPRPPSEHVPPPMRRRFIDLQCLFDPAGVIPALKRLPPDFVDQDVVVQTCESREVFDAAMWVLNRDGRPSEALAKAEAFDQKLAVRVGQHLAGATLAEDSLEKLIGVLQAVGRMAVAICVEHSSGTASDVPVADMWFLLLRAQIELVQSVSACCPIPSRSIPEPDSETDATRTVSTLRSLVQETFSSLVGASFGRAVSFPRLFTRLVDATSKSERGTPYTEFRTILTSMMDSYRSEGDMLGITKHLLDRDIFETVAEVTRERARGWAPSRGMCSTCRKPATMGMEEDRKLVVVRSGALYHSKCVPADLVAPR
ncbi:Golgi CORVET complex core vacuolar protein 8-domain-containing protein [Vararia minispora EC-137]|uniref:Golgi CORVET complex core vacuolar protein 8-domain-containing protein n=1 Tax=Vararia minispora EC-137 TaxID=1314806 RepID=A0ACB8QE42_9AGAM|nr:Golgi CORVET complex core vacuolar protein 8-domain-containing protein [Vararia minispora EC-137]